MEKNEDELKKILDKKISEIDTETLNGNKAKHRRKLIDFNTYNLLLTTMYDDEKEPNVFINTKKFDKLDKKDDFSLADFISNNKVYYTSTIDNFLKILNDNQFYYVFKNPKEKINDDLAFNLICGFYNSLDESKGKIVESIINSNNLILTEPLDKLGYEGLCLHLHDEKLPYLLCECDEQNLNLESILTIVHELGHSIEYIYSSNRSMNCFYAKDLMTVEITSLFYEYLFLDYLKKHHLFNEDINNALGFILYARCENALSLKKVFSREIECEFGKLKYIDNTAYIKQRNIYKTYEDEDHNLYQFQYDSQDDLRYTLGNAYALHFLKQYNDDPELFNRNFNDFLSTRSLLTLDQILNLFNIDKEEFLSLKQVKPIVKQYVRNYNKELYRK